MKVLFFWEAVGGLSLEHRCNPYAGLLARELEKLDIHLVLGDYDFERGWLERKPTVNTPPGWLARCSFGAKICT